MKQDISDINAEMCYILKKCHSAYIYIFLYKSVLLKSVKKKFNLNLRFKM